MTDTTLRRLLRRLGPVAAESPESLSLDELEALEPRFDETRSPLLRAEFTLLRARRHETRRPLADMVQQLELALVTFAANACRREQAQCLAQLCYWYNLMGHEVTALAAARHALRQPELPATDRLALFHPVAMAYAHQLRLPDAWAAWEQDFAALSARCVSPRLALQVNDVLASLHFFEALRARRVASVYTLDLPEGRPDDADETAFQQHMQAALLAVQHRGWLDRRTQDLSQHRSLRGMLAALRGDQAGMLTDLADPPGPVESGGPSHGQITRLYNLGWSWHVLGHSDRALPCLLTVRNLTASSGRSKLSSRLPYDLSCVHARLGDHAAAHRELQAFLCVRAEVAAADLVSLGRLQDLGARVRLMQATSAPAVPQPMQVGSQAIDPVRLHQSEPPYLARLYRLLAERASQRIRLTDIAAELGVSLRTLQSAVQRYRGTTLGGLQRGITLQRASDRLRHTDQPIHLIAAELGFSDPASFSHAFRREFGVSPSVHRRQLADVGAGTDAPPPAATPPTTAA